MCRAAASSEEGRTIKPNIHISTGNNLADMFLPLTPKSKTNDGKVVLVSEVKNDGNKAAEDVPIKKYIDDDIMRLPGGRYALDSNLLDILKKEIPGVWEIISAPDRKFDLVYSFIISHWNEIQGSGKSVIKAITQELGNKTDADIEVREPFITYTRESLTHLQKYLMMDECDRKKRLEEFNENSPVYSLLTLVKRQQNGEFSFDQPFWKTLTNIAMSFAKNVE